MFSVCQIYKVWKQFTTTTVRQNVLDSCFQYVKFIKFESNSQLILSIRLFQISCFQYVKFIKFESNSQHSLNRLSPPSLTRSCFQYVKFIKFESNSQRQTAAYSSSVRCFQYVKFIKFESNSQLLINRLLAKARCFQYVKFIKFESNSQLLRPTCVPYYGVFSMSNLESLKAIHNRYVQRKWLC